MSLFTLNSQIRSFKRSRMTRVALVALVLMPLLYSALYLWAFWDPFNNVNRLPIALVNSDKGTTTTGSDGQREQLRAGDKVVQGLHASDKITWIDTTEEDAAEGVKNGRYYFSLQIPENFSQAVASPAGDSPEKARLITTLNDTNGYLSTIIGNNVMKEVLGAVSTKISAQAVDKVLVGVMDAGSGLERAAVGAGQLADGTSQLRQGSTQLDDGANRLHDGLAQAKDGSGQLVTGAAQLDDGLEQLSDGAQRLSQGTAELNSKVGGAAQEIQRSTANFNQLQRGADQLGQFSGSVNSSVRQLNEYAYLLPPEQRAQLQQLVDQTGQMDYQLNDPSSPLRSGMNKIASLPEQFDALQQGVSQINDGAQQLSSGLDKAHDGSTRLADGTVRLDQGNQKLLDGSAALADGTGRAVDGTAKLDDGAQRLKDGLEQGANRVPDMNADQARNKAETIGNPVELASFNDSGSHAFGPGLAPFFFSLALYIGAIVIFFLLRPLQTRIVNSGIAPFRAAFDGYLPGLLIGLGQAVVMTAVTVWAVGLEPANLVGTFALSALVSMMFVAQLQMLIAVFGPGPGKVVSMAVLILQMISSGGLYPVETQNGFIQAIHHVNPMTYTVNAYREVIYGAYDGRLPVALAVICAVVVGCLLVTSLAARSQRTWTMKRLHPAITM